MSHMYSDTTSWPGEPHRQPSYPRPMIQWTDITESSMQPAIGRDATRPSHPSTSEQPDNLQRDRSGLTLPDSATEYSFGQTISHTSTHIDRINPDLLSRNLSVVALCLAWCVGIAAVTIGARIIVTGRVPAPEFIVGKQISFGSGTRYLFAAAKPGRPPSLWLEGHRLYDVQEAAMIIIGLLLNMALTVILDGMNFIPATTMRWALHREGRLHFNSNLRIFGHSRTFAANGFCANTLSAVALVLAYGGASILTFPVTVISNAVAAVRASDVPLTGPRYGIDFSAWGCIGLGMGLILQAALASWCLAGSLTLVPTWSSNPLGTARASRILTGERLSPVDALYQPSTTDSLAISRPKHRQVPMIKLAPQVRWINRLIWAMAAVISIWTVVIGIYSTKQDDPTSTTGWVAKNGDEASSWNFWLMYGQTWVAYSPNTYSNRRDWLGLIIQCLVLSVVTLTLHGVELVAHASRDESIWRKATTTGADPDQGVIKAGLSNWANCILFAFKVVIHWIFAFAFAAEGILLMNLLPLVALSVCFIVLAVFAEILTRWRPKGPQPSTFGNLEALMAMVDDWDHRLLFWGDKGELKSGIRLAGTAGRRRAELDFDAYYLNLKYSSKRISPKSGRIFGRRCSRSQSTT